MRTTKIIALLLLAAALVLPSAAFAVPKAGASAQTVKDFYATLSSVMQQGDQLGFAGRYKKLAPAIKNAFNLPLMTRFAVGPVWMKATAGEQKQLISAFSDFSIATYASRFAKYDGEQFRVKGEKPAQGGGIIVETELQPKDGDAVTLNYLMRPDDSGAYKIVDVFLDGTISELATRRAEFSSIVRRDGIAALVNQLDEKSKQLGPS